MQKDLQQFLERCNELSPGRLILLERMCLLLLSRKEKAISTFDSIVNPHLEAGTFTSEVMRKALDSAEEVEPWEAESRLSECCSA